jgi:hypothetical protein
MQGKLMQVLTKIKVFIFFVVSFLVSDVGGLFLCMALQSFIRSIICGACFGRVMSMRRPELGK